METKRKIIKQQILVPVYYNYDEETGDAVYDFEEMANYFEQELSKLDENVVVMCSVEEMEELTMEELLQDWKIIQQEYYEQFSRSSVERLYVEWYDDRESPSNMSKDEMIGELLESELDDRRDDTIEELKETIKHIEKLNFNN
tara:strand:+ start:460 stop:888 length:429 start_codon:yes stop_codon:yes gene_type:complete